MTTHKINNTNQQITKKTTHTWNINKTKITRT